MTTPKKPTDPKKQQLADALRENLMKRKAQSRARDQQTKEKK